MPSILHLSLSFLSVLFLYLIITLYRNHCRLCKFRGPFLASLSDLWLLKASINCRVHFAQRDALEKYGDVARIGPNLLVTSNPGLLRHMSAPRSAWTRGDWYEVFNLGGETETVFSRRDEKKHAHLRAKLGPGAWTFSSTEQVVELIQLVRTQYAARHVHVDMTRLSQYFTLDVLSKIAFGNAFGYLKANTDLYEYIETGQAFLPVLELLCNHAWLRPIVFSPLVQKLLAPKDADNVGMGKILNIAHQAVDERYAAAAPADPEKHGAQRKDMLGSFISAGLSRQEAQSESHIQILAGSDSTSTAVRMTMLYLVTNPLAYNTLRAEIDLGVAEGRIEKESTITDAQARKLPYLQAVIWEGLRKCPPLFGLGSKVAPLPHGETVNGIFYPPGTEVGVCPAAVTHREDVFGLDAAVFRPERWTDSDETTRETMRGVVDLIFGSGRFGCLRKNIAFLELNKVFVELLRNFEWAVVDAMKPVKVNVGNCVWLQTGMMMTVSERMKQSTT